MKETECDIFCRISAYSCTSSFSVSYTVWQLQEIVDTVLTFFRDRELKPLSRQDCTYIATLIVRFCTVFVAKNIISIEAINTTANN